jgi:SNF2 family DNA or RNA helicase
MIRHTKDILDLPPKIRNYKVFTQPKGYRKEIDRLHEIYGKISVGALQKLRQWVAIKKTDDIVTYVNDIIEQKDDNKVIVFCNYIEPTNIIAKKLNVKAHTSEITKPEDRQDIIDKFTNNENEKVLCMSIRTGNVGLNLTQANHIVFCDFSYSPSDMLQAEDRAHRIGQEKTVNIHYLSAENTIDEQAIDLLTKKTKILNGVIDGKPYQYDHTDEENIESSIISELNKMFTEFGQE